MSWCLGGISLLFSLLTARAEDVVVYGGTSAGVVAAVQAARMGRSVVLIEPGRHLGGLSSGGLGMTDSGNKAVIGGLSREFYQRIRKHYAQDSAWTLQKREDYTFQKEAGDALFRFEPHVAEQVFRDLLAEAKVPVVYGERLDLKGGVAKEASRITALRMESGRTFAGRVFIDATYEGDLMAGAGVHCAVGREANAQYGETLNGVQTARARSHQFQRPVDPYREPGKPESGLLPGVHGDKPGEEGAGDRRIQAYNFRMCLTDVPGNRVPFPKPDGYDPLRYELLARYLTPDWKDIFGNHQAMPNRKTDTNNNGGFGTDNIGMNYDYPDGDYATRERILRDHETYQKGLMWFLANEPRVPAPVRERVGRWGLAKDEFTDNGNWPRQLYVREARRMIGDYVHTELDCRRTRVTPDSVGMGSYNMDSHHVQRYVDADGHARNEGDIQISPGGPYMISYRSIRPKAGECDNLLVPVCISCSHIAYGSVRMEPVFMILGQSAATAACLALENNATVQQVPYEKLRDRLLADGQVLEWKPAAKKAKTRGQDEWQSLFDGRSLAGWTVRCQPADRDKAFWAVADGAIVCDSIGRRDHNYVWLISDREFGDFELRLKFQAYRDSPGNSGLQFRSRFDSTWKDGWLDGPQVDIHPPASMSWRTGFIYDETREERRWVCPSLKDWNMDPALKPAKHVFKYENDGDGWNELSLVCKGNHVTTLLNGVTVADWDGTGVLDNAAHVAHKVGKRGHLALQLHTGDELRIRFTEIRVREAAIADKETR